MRILKTFILTLLFLRSFVAFSQDPDAPLITYVSVNHSTQQVDINWVNTTTDVVGYVIYFQDISGLWIPLDTIMGINNTNYSTQNANPQQKIETFSVVAFDALGNSSVRSDSHSTVFLQYDYENCDTILQLNWNSYLNMYGMDGYQLKITREDLLSGIPFQNKQLLLVKRILLMIFLLNILANTSCG